jgi:hypothetical protein
VSRVLAGWLLRTVSVAADMGDGTVVNAVEVAAPVESVAA